MLPAVAVAGEFGRLCLQGRLGWNYREEAGGGCQGCLSVKGSKARGRGRASLRVTAGMQDLPILLRAHHWHRCHLHTCITTGDLLVASQASHISVLAIGQSRGTASRRAQSPTTANHWTARDPFHQPRASTAVHRVQSNTQLRLKIGHSCPLPLHCTRCRALEECAQVGGTWGICQ